MSGITLTYNFSGTLHAGLNRLIAAGEDLSPVMLKASTIMHEATLDRFEYEADPLGLPWAPTKRKKAEGGKILVQSRQLLDAIHSESDAKSARVGVKPDSQRSGSAPVKDYAAAHQDGSRRWVWSGKANGDNFAGRVLRALVIPRRAYLGFSTGEISAIDAALGAHISNAWSGAAGTAGGAQP